MMEYNGTYWKMLLPLMKRSLKKRFTKEETAALIKKADAEYRAMLSRIDDIGKDNPMALNIYSCLFFLAIWKAADGRITVDGLREMTHEMLGTPILKSLGIFMNANNPSGIKRIEKMMTNGAGWLEKNPQYKAVSWDFNFDRRPEGFAFHFTRCPLNDFARKEGCLEVLPVMCETDKLTAGLMHAKLLREHTLASGGEICDYWFVGDKSPLAK